MKTEIFIQARMGSSRLPGKVLKKVLGKPLLSYLIDRLKKVQKVDQLVILTTEEMQDDQIVAICEKEGVPFFRGSEENVLERYYQAALSRETDRIVRITADCPLMDPSIVDQVIQAHATKPLCDYTSNSLKRTFPRGMDVEIFSFKTLEKAFQEATKEDEKEHVSVYFYRHPEIFNLQNVAHEPSLAHYRLTVDTLEDFQLIELIFKTLYPKNKNFQLQDIVDLLQAHPQWVAINAHIEQKKIKI